MYLFIVKIKKKNISVQVYCNTYIPSNKYLLSPYIQ